jgi:hypothetical protein
MMSMNDPIRVVMFPRSFLFPASMALTLDLLNQIINSRRKSIGHENEILY